MAATLTEVDIQEVDIQEEDILAVVDIPADILVVIQAQVDVSSVLDPCPCHTTLSHTLLRLLNTNTDQLLSTVQCPNTDHSTNLLPSQNTAQLPDPFMVHLRLLQFNNISQHLHPHMVPQLRSLHLWFTISNRRLSMKLLLLLPHHLLPLRSCQSLCRFKHSPRPPLTDHPRKLTLIPQVTVPVEDSQVEAPSDTREVIREVTREDIKEDTMEDIRVEAADSVD